MIIVFNCTAAKGQDPPGKTGGGAGSGTGTAGYQQGAADCHTGGLGADRPVYCLGKEEKQEKEMI